LGGDTPLTDSHTGREESRGERRGMGSEEVNDGWIG